MGGRRQYTGFIDGESARLQVAQERGALPRHVLQLHLTDGNLELRNTEGDTSIATCRSTEGRANRRKYVCPKCGKIHSFPDTAFCKNCQDMFYISTVFGKVLKGTSAEYKGKKYPSFLFKKDVPYRSSDGTCKSKSCSSPEKSVSIR